MKTRTANNISTTVAFFIGCIIYEFTKDYLGIDEAFSLRPAFISFFLGLYLTWKNK